MTGMIPPMMILRAVLAPTAGPNAPAFWFVMSMALLVGFISAYPMNWWLVANGLKHGMLNIRRTGRRATAEAPLQTRPAPVYVAAHVGKRGTVTSGNDHGQRAPTSSTPVMTLASFLTMTVGAVIAWFAVSRLPGW